MRILETVVATVVAGDQYLGIGLMLGGRPPAVDTGRQRVLERFRCLGPHCKMTTRQEKIRLGASHSHRPGNPK